jgi:hypothetical protein
VRRPPHGDPPRCGTRSSSSKSDDVRAPDGNSGWGAQRASRACGGLRTATRRAAVRAAARARATTSALLTATLVGGRSELHVHAAASARRPAASALSTRAACCARSGQSSHRVRSGTRGGLSELAHACAASAVPGYLCTRAGRRARSGQASRLVRAGAHSLDHRLAQLTNLALVQLEALRAMFALESNGPCAIRTILASSPRPVVRELALTRPCSALVDAPRGSPLWEMGSSGLGAGGRRVSRPPRAASACGMTRAAPAVSRSTGATAVRRTIAPAPPSTRAAPRSARASARTRPAVRPRSARCGRQHFGGGPRRDPSTARRDRVVVSWDSES